MKIPPPTPDEAIQPPESSSEDEIVDSTGKKTNTNTNSTENDLPEEIVSSPPEELNIALCSQKIATKILDSECQEEENSSLIHTLQMRLIDEEEFELGYWLDKVLADKSALPKALAELLQIGLRLHRNNRDAEERLTELFIQAAENFEAYGDNEQLLLAAATIRPALLAPHTHPGYIITELTETFSYLDGYKSFMTELGDFVKFGLPLAEESFHGPGNLASWEAQGEKLKEETTKWFNNSHKHKMGYKAATRIWTHWCSDGGDLASLVNRCIILDGSIKELEAEVSKWSNPKNFDDILDRTDLQINRRAKKMPIRYSARDQLIRLVNEATHLATRWLDQHITQPQNESNYVEHSRKTLDVLKTNTKSVVESISQIIKSTTGEKTKTCYTILANGLADITNNFHATNSPQLLGPIERRNLELRKLPATHSSMVEKSSTGITFILNQIAHPLTADQAISRHINDGYLGQARSLLKLSKNQNEIQKIIDERQKELRKRPADDPLAKISRLSTMVTNQWR